MIKNFNNLLLIFILIFLFVFIGNIFIINFTFGATDSTVTTGGGFANPLGTTDITTLLKKIISYLIMIGAPILAIMVIYGGYLILTAGDDPEKVKGGKNTILYATIGYIIIISSYGIIYIVKEVLGAK